MPIIHSTLLVSGTSVHIESRKEELDYWKHVAFILIFICTGITVKQTKIDKWIKQNAFRIPQGRFVCGLDKTVTSDIWGQDFVTLANTIGGRNMQQQRQWEQDAGEPEQRNMGSIWESRLADRSRTRCRMDGKAATMVFSRLSA